MAQAGSAQTPMTLVVGGDPYVGDRMARSLCRAALDARPDAERVELDAARTDRYAFEEAVGPSLLGEAPVVLVTNLQDADERLVDAMERFCRQADGDASGAVVVCRHEGGPKGRRIIDRLVRAGARQEKGPDLKSPEAKVNFVVGRFEARGRRVAPAAAQLLVGVLGDRMGELAAMCDQLCDDFDDDPIDASLAGRYLTADPQVTGFAVADTAMAGRAAEAVVMMRSAIAQGTEPIALIGALAAKLRTLAKAAAVRSGTLTAGEAHVHPWVLRQASRQLGGWTSPGLARCIGMLAWADEQSKTNGGDPLYALERCIGAIAVRGRENG